ncbi:MAG TPA: DUF72 domain-containing protein [Ktedonobacterales bacterium]|nr:DUF72 domain-containing protein [Ktedonobacterales bacterium]
MSCPVSIGTSGWHYAHWRGPFYPNDLPTREWLSFYAQRFETVEINNSFYHLPTTDTLASWAHDTPPHFRFAAKASRYLTHMKKLKDPEPAVATFLDRMEALGEKLGPILCQLPPHWGCDLQRLESFLAILPAERRFALELRDPSWQTPEVMELLARYRVANCVFDLDGVQSPIALTTDFAYVRLHGPAGPYQGCYGDQALSDWAERLRAWRTSLTSGVYVYFDNDQAGFAARNALELRALVER